MHEPLLVALRRLPSRLLKLVRSPKRFFHRMPRGGMAAFGVVLVAQFLLEFVHGALFARLWGRSAYDVLVALPSAEWLYAEPLRAAFPFGPFVSYQLSYAATHLVIVLLLGLVLSLVLQRSAWPVVGWVAAGYVALGFLLGLANLLPLFGIQYVATAALSFGLVAWYLAALVIGLSVRFKLSATMSWLLLLLAFCIIALPLL